MKFTGEGTHRGRGKKMAEKEPVPVRAFRKSSRRKRRDDLGLWFQDYLGASRTAEETLFKINELLASGRIESTRKNIRAPIPLAVSFRIDGEINITHTYTLSQRGLFLKWASPPPEGTRVEMEIHLPGGGGVVSAEGVVVNSVSMEEALGKGTLSGMAVVFDRIRPEDRHALERLVRSQARHSRPLP